MRTITRVAVTGAMALAVTGLFVLSSNAQNKDLQASVDKIAGSIAKGDTAGAMKQAQAVGKTLDEDVSEAMQMFRLRKKKGVGVGDKPGAVDPDGIEKMYENLAGGKAGPNGKALEQMAYRTAAIADIALALTPKQDMGKKTRKLWTTSAQEMRAGALALATAVKSGNAAAIKTAATKVNAACTNCHDVFKN